MNFLPGSFILLAMWLLMFSEILLSSEELMVPFLGFPLGLATACIDLWWDINGLIQPSVLYASGLF